MIDKNGKLRCFLSVLSVSKSESHLVLPTKMNELDISCEQNVTPNSLHHTVINTMGHQFLNQN